MHRARCLIYVALLLTLVLRADEAAWRESLRTRIEDPKFAGAEWGILVRKAGDGAVLFATNEHRPLKPASNAKLLTTAYALRTLGPEARIKTPIMLEGAMAAPGEWKGHLVVRGMTDPSWSSRAMDGSPDAFGKIVGLLTNEGIRKISGDLVLETGVITGGRWGAHWLDSDHPRAYGAEVGAINVLDNASEVVVTANPAGGPAKVRFSPEVPYLSTTGRVQTVAGSGRDARIQLDRLEDERVVRLGGSLGAGLSNWVGLIAVPKPSEWALMLLRERLRREGIEVTGQVRTRPVRATPSLGETHELGMIESPPLPDLLKTMLKESQNLYAESLFRLAGEAQREPTTPPVSSESLAKFGLTQFLAGLGAPTNEFTIEDGSGLSRAERCSASVIVTAVDHLLTNAPAGWLRDALPIAGVDGTLRQRHTRAPLKGNLRAKTGTLRGVATLSGLVRARSGDTLVFSLLLNDDSASLNGRQEIDALIETVAQYPGGTPNPAPVTATGKAN